LAHKPEKLGKVQRDCLHRNAGW